MIVSSFGAAFKAIGTNKTRSVLTMLGVMIGVAALEAMVAIGDGAENRLSERIRSLGTNLLLIQPGSVTKGGASLGRGSVATLSHQDATAIGNEVMGVVAAVPGVAERAQVVAGNRNWSTIVTGVTEGFHVAREWPVDAGREMTADDVRRAEKAAFIGRTVAQELFQGSDPIGQRLRLGEAPFIVAGLLAEKGESSGGNDQDDVVLVPISTAKLRVFGSDQADKRSVQYVLVKVESDALMASVESDVSALLRQRHRLKPDEKNDFKVRNLAEVMAARKESSRILNTMLIAIASVSLLVGGISIMNIMLVSVNERTREIGLRLALGATRGNVLSQFVIESLVISILGGLIGAMLGAVIAVGVGVTADWPIVIRPAAIVFAFVFAALVGLGFGYWPALKASRLDPIKALRHE